MEMLLIYPIFAVLAFAALLLQTSASKTKQQVISGNNPHFKKFQNTFFLVYFMALFSDWLQGEDDMYFLMSLP